MSNPKDKVKAQLLEVPAQTSLERRLLLNDGAPKAKPNIRGDLPPSALLGRLQDFLPRMQQANAVLATQAPEATQMEQHSDDEGPRVELDLACGLFDLKDDAAVAAAERSLVNPDVVVERYNNSGSSGSDDDSDSEGGESDEPTGGHAAALGGEGQASIGASKDRKSAGRRRRHAGIEELP